MPTLIFIAIAGFAAQLVDGGIGMGFGVTSTTLLIFLAGLGPAQASAVVHAAELGTTLVSGFSHWRFGNVDWRIVFSLAIPGGIAAFIGATLLSNLSLEAASPITSGILLLIAINLIWRFSRGHIRRTITHKPHARSFLVALGSVGGLVDATGGGGWGPVTTSTLMAAGREKPSRIVGTVSAAEFLVTFGATAGFAVGLWEDVVAHLGAIIAMLIGGSLAAPIAAWLISRLNPTMLGGFVGTAIAALNVSSVYQGLGFSPSGGWAVAIHGAIILVGIGATIRGHLKTRAVQTPDESTERTERKDAVVVHEAPLRAHEEAKTG